MQLPACSDEKTGWCLRIYHAVAQLSRSLCYRFLDERWPCTGVENEGLKTKGNVAQENMSFLEIIIFRFHIKLLWRNYYCKHLV